ncbi:MAG TPA: hypothetical protein VMW78_02980 [Anaerolineae bacterium]|nr:hypothetical protein [Anaerolineae bacterium]
MSGSIIKKTAGVIRSRRNAGYSAWIVQCLTGLCFLLTALVPSTLYGAGGSLYADDSAHFSLAMPSGVQEISQDWLEKSLFDPKHLKWCKDAVEKYDKTFVYLDDTAQTAKGLVLFGVRTYKHEKKRFKVFTDRLETDDFFDPGVIKDFIAQIEKRLVEKGAKDVTVGTPVLNKDRNDFSFTCNYLLFGEHEAKEFHWVFMGRTHLVYLDINLYAADDVAVYQSLIEDIAASFKFEQGFEAKGSYVDAFADKIEAYNLFGISLSELGRSMLAVSMIIFILNFLLNLILGRVTNPSKKPNAITEFCQRNKMWARLATVPVGIFLYLAHC